MRARTLLWLRFFVASFALVIQGGRYEANLQGFECIVWARKRPLDQSGLLALTQN